MAPLRPVRRRRARETAAARVQPRCRLRARASTASSGAPGEAARRRGWGARRRRRRRRHGPVGGLFSRPTRSRCRCAEQPVSRSAERDSFSGSRGGGLVWVEGGEGRPSPWAQSRRVVHVTCAVRRHTRRAARGALFQRAPAAPAPAAAMATRDLTTQYLRLRSAMHRKRGPDAGAWLLRHNERAPPSAMCAVRVHARRRCAGAAARPARHETAVAAAPQRRARAGRDDNCGRQRRTRRPCPHHTTMPASAAPPASSLRAPQASARHAPALACHPTPPPPLPTPLVSRRRRRQRRGRHCAHWRVSRRRAAGLVLQHGARVRGDGQRDQRRHQEHRGENGRAAGRARGARAHHV